MYTLMENTDPSMQLTNFGWRIDDTNNALVTWDWPTNRQVKLMLVFTVAGDDEQNPGIERFLQEERPHEVITRDLVSRYSVQIPQGRRRFLICPGCFSDNFSADKTVTVLSPAYITDWIYRKTHISARAECKPVPLGSFQRINLEIRIDDTTQLPLITEVLTYSICEGDKVLAEYPIDKQIIEGGCGFYIAKNQEVQFTLEQGHEHLLELRTR